MFVCYILSTPWWTDDENVVDDHDDGTIDDDHEDERGNGKKTRTKKGFLMLGRL